MIMDLLGPSLEFLFDHCNCSFSSKTVLMLADRLLCQLQAVHEAGLLHGDIKPGNFAIGPEEREDLIHIIDFGLCREYVDAEGNHLAYKEGEKVRGTAKYMSANCHRGVLSSRRDELEALAYMLVEFHHGELPWDELSRTLRGRELHRRLGETKAGTSPEELCAGLPCEFAEFLAYCQGLGFDEEPDYGRWRAAFQQRLVSEGHKDDGLFDWAIDDMEQHAVKAECDSSDASTSLIAPSLLSNSS
jgi:casein kinase I family protein HRR25